MFDCPARMNTFTGFSSACRGAAKKKHESRETSTKRVITSCPLLNGPGSITSKCRHFLLIGRWSLLGVGDLLRRQRIESRFRYNMEPAAQHLAGKATHQNGQPFDLGFAIRELDK